MREEPIIDTSHRYRLGVRREFGQGGPVVGLDVGTLLHETVFAFDIPTDMVWVLPSIWTEKTRLSSLPPTVCRHVRQNIWDPRNVPGRRGH